MAWNKKRGKRVFVGMRMDPDLKRRVNRIKEKQRSSERSVIEQLLDAGIAELERKHGIDPELPDAGPGTEHN
jgi:predicted transcriptional regulator